MDAAVQFEEILAKEKVDEIVDFVSSLDNKSKKAVGKKLNGSRFVWEYNTKKVNQGGFSYNQPTTPKGTKAQQKIFVIGSFFCHGRRDFSREWSAQDFLTKDLLDQLLPIFIPAWFSDYINDINKEGWLNHRFTYLELLDLEEKGYLELSPAMIAHRIAWAITEYTEDNKTYYRPEVLLRYKNTLARDIWYLFEYESNVHFGDPYREFENAEGNNAWESAFKWLADENKVSRDRLLSEALLASNRNFNKSVSGWFIRLFFLLEPTEDDLLALQSQLVGILSSPHSHVVNGSLKAIKKIQSNKTFDAQQFIGSAVFLLTSEVKSVVKSVLMILEKIAKRNENLRESICQSVVQVFASQDGELQLRAAKLIMNYAPEGATAVQEEIGVYAGALLSDAKAILDGWLPEVLSTAHDKNLEPELDVASGGEPATLEKFPAVSNFEELLFHASQAFDNHDPSHFDILVDGLIRFNHEVTGSNIAKLEPALQRAMKLVIGDFHATIGILDNMLATFFTEYCDYLAKTYPTDALPLKELSEDFRRKDRHQAREFSWYHQRITPLSTWHTSQNTPIYYLFRKMLMLALARLKQGIQLPLLSTPTHLPCWIDPNVLLERVAEYQQANVEIDALDFQMALARVDNDLSEVDYTKLEQVSAEQKSLLEYAFGRTAEIPEGNINLQLLIAAAIMRNDGALREVLAEKGRMLDAGKYTGDFEWGPIHEKFTDKRYDYQKNRYVPFENERKEVRIAKRAIPTTEKPGGLLGLFRRKVLPGYKSVYYSVYADQVLKEQWLQGVDNDVPRFLSLAPNNPGSLIISIIERCCKYSPFISENDKRLVIKSLEYLLNIWKKYDGITQDYLGICMMCSDKTARTIAGEIWIAGCENDSVDQIRIGAAVAKMNAFDFSPLKRFTDLATTIYSISALHKKRMNELLYACITNLSDTPPRNVRKVLELFKETIANREELRKDQAFIQKLNGWALESQSLAKLVNSIL